MFAYVRAYLVPDAVPVLNFSTQLRPPICTSKGSKGSYTDGYLKNSDSTFVRIDDFVWARKDIRHIGNVPKEGK